MHPLPREFYEREADAVARDLLGTWLVYRPGTVPRVGRIVETEAYLGPHDLASHSRRGPTARNSSMFGPPGHAYVYLIYGMHHCLNIVTGPEGHGAAVLLRALEPIDGIEGDTRGPGRLCRTLGIDRRLDGVDLLGVELFLTRPVAPEPVEILAGPRIGIGYAGAWTAEPLRFHIAGNLFRSRP